jgi:hypothetical protein
MDTSYRRRRSTTFVVMDAGISSGTHRRTAVGVRALCMDSGSFFCGMKLC